MVFFGLEILTRKYCTKMPNTRTLLNRKRFLANATFAMFAFCRYHTHARGGKAKRTTKPSHNMIKNNTKSRPNSFCDRQFFSRVVCSNLAKEKRTLRHATDGIASGTTMLFVGRLLGLASSSGKLVLNWDLSCAQARLRKTCWLASYKRGAVPFL